jgi:hypothetical protein
MAVDVVVKPAANRHRKYHQPQPARNQDNDAA